MQTTAAGEDRTTLGLRPAGAPLTVGRQDDSQGLRISAFDRVLCGMVNVGLVQEAICRFLLLTIETLSYHLVRLDLPTPSERAMRKPSGKRPWTDDEVRLLIELWTADLRTSAIAVRLERSAGSVRSKARRLGLYRRNRRDLIEANTATEQAADTTEPSTPAEIVAETVHDASPSLLALLPNAAISVVPVTAIEETAAPISSEIVVAPTSRISTRLSALSGIVFAASDASPAVDADARDVLVPDPPAPEATNSAGTATKRPRPRRIDWTDELSEEVARRWFAYQHHRGIADDLGMSEAQVRSQAHALGLPRRERKKIVADYVKGRPYDTTLERSMVKRHCRFDHKVFWGTRNGPHTSPRAMRTKRYKAHRSGLEEARAMVSLD